MIWGGFVENNGLGAGRDGDGGACQLRVCLLLFVCGIWGWGVFPCLKPTPALAIQTSERLAARLADLRIFLRMHLSHFGGALAEDGGFGGLRDGDGGACQFCVCLLHPNI